MLNLKLICSDFYACISNLSTLGLLGAVPPEANFRIPLES